MLRCATKTLEVFMIISHQRLIFHILCPPQLYHPNNMWHTVQIMQHLFSLHMKPNGETLQISSTFYCMKSARDSASLYYAMVLLCRSQCVYSPFIRKKNAPVSFATARAISVFPVPGGPYSKIPRGGFTPMALNKLGCRSGSSTISFI
jgi:hypothetical protein